MKDNAGMITRDEVRYVARLARLELTEAETDLYTRQLGAVLEYARQLDAVDTAGVEPTCFVAADHDPLRDDAVNASLSREEILANAHRVKDGYFSVPRVLGGRDRPLDRRSDLVAR